MLGLGGSVGTNNTAITAQVLVVDSYEELDRVQAQVPGKIVLFNGVWDTSYGKSVQFRSRGAIKASQYGAVAVLVRSVTPFSLQSPHTGNTNYDASVPKIPAAAITVEDASYMRRVQDRGGQTITVTLTMGAERLPPAPSFNLIGEIKGSKYPNQYVIMGGHTDSWDVGQGAHDDAGGVFAAWEALRLIKSSGLVPQRTIRVVGWVDEEQGGSGGNQYVIDHANELPNTVIAMESDTGTFNPTQLAFTGTTKGYSGARKFGSYYLEKFLNVEVGSTPYPDADITPLAQRGVPTFSMRNSGNVSPGFKYFEYHHTHADTFDKIDKEDFNKNVAVFAVAAWVASAGEWALK
jgi:carboxypeptidase Q